MTNAPLANISDDVSLPTKWLGFLHPNYIKMLNKMPNLNRNELIASADRYAKSHFITNANTVILYAIELIDEYYISNNIRPPTSIMSLPTNKKFPIQENNINTKKSPTTDDQSIIESVSRVFMNELNENRKSQLEDQQKRDIEQRKLESEQTEVHREIINTMHEMSKNPSSIDKKGATCLIKW